MINRNKKISNQCGKNLSKWHVDFSRVIICGSYSISHKYLEQNKNFNSEIEIGQIKKIYDEIESRENMSLVYVAFLEQVTGHDFISAKDFQNKMQKFIDKHFSPKETAYFCFLVNFIFFIVNLYYLDK